MEPMGIRHDSDWTLRESSVRTSLLGPHLQTGRGFRVQGLGEGPNTNARLVMFKS